MRNLLRFITSSFGLGLRMLWVAALGSLIFGIIHATSIQPNKITLSNFVLFSGVAAFVWMANMVWSQTSWKWIFPILLVFSHFPIIEIIWKTNNLGSLQWLIIPVWTSCFLEIYRNVIILRDKTSPLKERTTS